MIERLRTLDRKLIRRSSAALAGLVLVAVTLAGLLYPDSMAGVLLVTATKQGTLEAALRLSVPIVFAALGGIYAEKAGVINIGLEGLLIVSAFTGVLVADYLGPAATFGPIRGIWLGFFAGVLASTLLALIFAIICIEFRADQIIAGLAIWLIALGLAPFAATVIYGSVNSESVGTFGDWMLPVLSDIPYVGAILFSAAPTVFMMLVAVPLVWYSINHTRFGRYVRASGENPKALDTVGVNVHRIRYTAVTLSGVLSGIGGAGLSLGQAGIFIGSGQTMVNGKGFIGIVAYLFGNYNPLGAFGAGLLFAGLDALQLRLQQVPGYAVPDQIIQMIPYVTVIVVLALVGKTRIPEAAGEHYESGEER